MKYKISAMLDKVANSLEDKGLIKEAFELDKIANTLDAKKIKCLKCKESIDYGSQPEIAMGAIECPNCMAVLDQTGKLLEVKTASTISDEELKSIIKKNEETAKHKPEIFKRTIYRDPTKEELEDVNSKKLSAKDILSGFSYTMVGRGMLFQKQKDQIVNAITLLTDLFPENKEYKEALDEAKKKKLHHS